MNIKLYYVKDDYIDYLRKYDNKVPYNKNSTRPYIGIVYTYMNNKYFAPLSSPKEKHVKISDKAVDVFKIDNGRLGIVNINNMIPTPTNCLKEALPTITDIKYKNLLQDQLTFINDNKKSLMKKVNQFQSRYRNNYLPKRIVDRSCNFPLLEKKCNQWTID